MALATKCPHCNTIFRVAHDQLKLRGGIVRCGACNEVFDGNAALVDPAARQATAMPQPAMPQPASPLPASLPFDAAMAALDTHAETALHAAAELSPYHLELDTVHDDAAVLADSPDDLAADAALTATAPQQDASGESVPDQAIDVVPDVPAAPAPAEAALELDLDVGDETASAVMAWEDDPLPAQDLAAEAQQGAQDQSDTPPHPPLGQTPDEETDGTVDALTDEATDPLADEATDETTDAPTDTFMDTASEPEARSDPWADSRREPMLDDLPSEHLTVQALHDELHHDGDDARFADSDPDEPMVSLSSAARASLDADADADVDADADSTTADTDAVSVAVADEQQGQHDQDEPGFVKRDRRRQRWGKAATAIMAIGSVLLLGALVGQGATTFRTQLSASVPQLRPALQSLCAALGCKIELPTQIDYVTIEQGELQTLSEHTFSFTTLLRNQSGTAQAWPHIELILDDASDKAVLRRVFAPRDYLADASAIAQGFPPHTEQSVKLYFELHQLKASGYHIAVFYP